MENDLADPIPSICGQPTATTGSPCQIRGTCRYHRSARLARLADWVTKRITDRGAQTFAELRAELGYAWGTSLARALELAECDDRLAYLDGAWHLAFVDGGEPRKPVAPRWETGTPDAFTRSGEAYRSPLCRAVRAEGVLLDAAANVACDNGRHDLARSLFGLACELRNRAEEEVIRL